ncbi:MAG: DNA alkylation repair protein [Cyclobacteriaceae bacterium]
MAEPLKNQFFQRPFFETLSSKITSEDSSWSSEKFFGLLYDNDWESIELKQRLKHASLSLGKCLPSQYEDALKILMKICDHFSGFDGMLFSEYVMDHGLEHPEVSLEALELFTQIGSAEFAIRPFILEHEEITMKKMRAWSKHENLHVRRLASEGSRPRLPWAPALPKFKKDASQVILILENLKDDPELYVRKSVANNLNDISKDHPDVVVELMSAWNLNASKDRSWIVKQALRSLVKDGNTGALSILGFEKVEAKIEDFEAPSNVTFGDKFRFSFELTNPTKKDAQFLVDYVVFHQKANGTLSPKVFKIGSYKIEGKGRRKIEKQHAIIPISTRKYYSGEHKIAIQVNGEILQELPFTLKID